MPLYVKKAAKTVEKAKNAKKNRRNREDHDCRPRLNLFTVPPLYVRKAAKIAEKTKNAKKVVGVARTWIVVLAWVLAKTRLNLFTASFLTGPRRETTFFILCDYPAILTDFR